MGWIASGRITNPTANQVVCTTAALPEGNRTVQLVVSATAQTAFELQQRNAANDTTIRSQIFAVPAFGTTSMSEPTTSFFMTEGETLRIIVVSAVTGSVSASLYTQE